MNWDLFRSIRSIRTIRSISYLLRSPHFHSLLIFIFFFCLYLSTAPRTNVSYADSDLLTTVGYQLGVAHPPGYPLYILLVHIFTHLPIPGTIAFRANLLSVVLQSASLSFIFLACNSLIKLLSSNPGISFFATHQIPGLAYSNPFNHLTMKPSRYSSRNNLYPILVSYAATLSLGFSFLYWLYGTVAEKYPLNNLFISITTYLIISLSARSHINAEKHYSLLPTHYFLIIVSALAINHHHTFLLVLPTLFLFFLFNFRHLKSSFYLSLFTFLFSLILPVILLIFINSRQVPISWHFDPTIKGLYTFLTRRELSGYLLIQGRYRGIYFDPPTINEVITKIPQYAQLLVNHFGIVPVGLYFLGLFILIHKSIEYVRTQTPILLHQSPKKVITDSRLSNFYLLLTILTLSTTIFIPLYLDWPDDLSTRAIRERLYLTGYVVMPLIITFSLYWLSSRVVPFCQRYSFKKSLILNILASSEHARIATPKYMRKHKLFGKNNDSYSKKRASSYSLYLLPVCVLLISLSFKLPQSYRQVYLRDFTFVSRFYRQTLNTLPPDTLLACISDVSCFALIYEQQINGIRPDVVILPHAYRIFEKYLDRPGLHGFDYQENPGAYLDYLSWNQNKRPVFVIELQQIYFNLMGMNYDLVHYLPASYLGQISVDKNQPLPTTDYSFSQELINTPVPANDLTRQQLKAALAQKHFLNALTYKRLSSSQSMIDQELNIGTKLVASLPAIYQEEAVKVRQLAASIDGFDQYILGIKDPTKQQILDQAQKYSSSDRPDLSLIGYNALLFRNPLDREVRMLLAGLYLSLGDKYSHQQEIDHLTRYPQ